MPKEMPIVKIKCPKCGCEESFKSITRYSECGVCTQCGEMTYYKRTREYDLPTPKQKVAVECPYCHSTNTKKISGISKAGSVALWGIFAAGKVAKQWHCNNCKSDF